MILLKDEVERFQAWAATQKKESGEWECDYEAWSALYAAAQAALLAPRLLDSDVERLLYALARDNECECILGMLTEHPENGMCMARAALQYPDPDARWQVAEFLGTRDEPAARELLRHLVADGEEYVRRRALLASVPKDPDFAAEVAWTWLSADYEYARLAALSVLHQLDSPRLAEAMTRLSDDASPYVQGKLAVLRNERGMSATGVAVRIQLSENDDAT